MMDSMTWDFIVRIFVAALLGGAIGLEREYRAKEAGFRTHFLVALGSALFMIVSAYGFEGALSSPSLGRVACGGTGGQRYRFHWRGYDYFPEERECRSRSDYCRRPVGDSCHRSGLWRWYARPGGCRNIPCFGRFGGLQLHSPQV